VVLYIFIVAALNLALGFGVAVLLGRRHRATVVADAAWSPDALLGPLSDNVPPGEESGIAGPETCSVQTPPHPSTATPSLAAPAAAPPAATRAQSEQDGPTQSSPIPPAVKSPGEQSVDDLSREVRQYDQQVAQADEKLRACAENPQAAEIEAILGSLMGSTQQYLESRNRLHGTFSQFCSGQAETGKIGEGLQAALQRQDAQIEHTSDMIEGFDYQADLKQGCQRMLDQTGRLIDSNDQLRDTLHETKTKLAENCSLVPTVEVPPQRDMPGELSGLTGLEAELHKWWDRQPDGSPHLSLAMIELDDSARLEQQHGGEVIDQVLRAVEELLQAAGGGEGQLLSLSRPQFCFVFPEADARLAVNTAERLRQTVQQTSLRYAETEIPVTVSCAVVGAEAGDTPGTLAERADATLQEARRYGCNRTFLHDGKYPAPVVPPVFSLSQQHVTL
jgi:diguanylate cyclase (GGDEF)-like protein